MGGFSARKALTVVEHVEQGVLLEFLNFALCFHILFLLAAEVVATVLRNSDSIKGITVNGISIKLCQLAEDMTLFLSNNGCFLCATNF